MINAIDSSCPLLTIAIPTYNRSHFLDKTLGALLPQVEATSCQTNSLIRVLVVDNNSEDDTIDVIKNHMQYYAFLSYVQNNHNIGIDGNIDRCVDLAESEFIHLLSDDDYVIPGLYARLIKLLITSSPDFVFLDPARDTCRNESVLELEKSKLISNQDKVSTDFKQISFEGLIKCAGIWMSFISSFVVRKESWQKVITRKKYLGTDIYLSYVAIEMLSKSNSIFISTAPYIIVNDHYSGSYNIMKAFLYNWLPLVSSLGKYNISNSTINFLERQVIASYLPNYILLAEKNGQLSTPRRIKGVTFLLQYPHRGSLRAIARLSGLEKLMIDCLTYQHRIKKVLRLLVSRLNKRL